MNQYFLPRGYVERLKPEAFPDEDDGVIWQVGVYELALDVLAQLETRVVVDIGCGRARKLEGFGRYGYLIIGYDCPDTASWLRMNAPWLNSRSCDLEHPTIEAPQGSLIICADVVEHLVDPSNLMRELARLRDEGCTVILSTPDRVLTYGPDQKGPPQNRCHVREWTMSEFVLLCQSFGLEGEFSYTQTTDKSEGRQTITAVFR